LLSSSDEVPGNLFDVPRADGTSGLLWFIKGREVRSLGPEHAGLGAHSQIYDRTIRPRQAPLDFAVTLDGSSQSLWHCHGDPSLAPSAPIDSWENMDQQARDQTSSLTRSRERNVQNRIVDCTVKATAGLPAVFSPGFGTTVRAGSR
jgi:hypothetical protein